MRLLVEILIIGGLIYLGWERPFKDQANRVKEAIRAAAHKVEHPAASEPQQTLVPTTTSAPTATPAPVPQPRVTITAPPPPSTPRGAWMWDEKHHSVLDRPAYGQTQAVQRYQDPLGRYYWIDAQGVRHYDQ